MTKHAWNDNNYEGKALRRVFSKLLKRFEKEIIDDDTNLDSLQKIAHTLSLVARTKSDLAFKENRIDGGRITDINTVEVYFLDGDGVTRNIPLEFELASKMVGVDGIISEVQYKIGKSNTSGESVTARIYKNNVEIGSCNLVTSTTSHSSCIMTLTESVVKDDLLAITDIVNADSSIQVEGKSAFVAITAS